MRLTNQDVAHARVRVHSRGSLHIRRGAVRLHDEWITSSRQLCKVISCLWRMSDNGDYNDDETQVDTVTERERYVIMIMI